MNQIIETKFATINTEFPHIVCILLKDIDPDFEERKDFFVQLENAINSIDGKFVIILDGTKLKWLNVYTKIKLGKKAKDIERKYQTRLMKGFVVAPNIMLKLLFEGFNIILQPIIEQEICNSHEEALIKSRECVCSF